MLELFYPYIMGLASILSPCTFVIVPVMLSQTRLRFFKIIQFLAGILITLSALGVIAAATGSLVTVSVQPYLLLIAAVLTLMAAFSLADFLEINLGFLMPKETPSNSLVMGLVFGFVIMACMSAPLGAVLAYIISRGNLLFGLLAMLFFSLGIATPFLILGALISNREISKRIIKNSRITRKIGSIVLFIVSVYLFVIAFAGIF